MARKFSLFVGYYSQPILSNFKYDNADYDSEEEDDDDTDDDTEPSGEDLPPEVQFERDVFAGAKRVRFYYELEVERPRQLRFPGGADASMDVLGGSGGVPSAAFENRRSVVRSEELAFDLRTDLYGDGLPKTTTTPSTPPTASVTSAASPKAPRKQPMVVPLSAAHTSKGDSAVRALRISAILVSNDLTKNARLIFGGVYFYLAV